MRAYRLLMIVPLFSLQSIVDPQAQGVSGLLLTEADRSGNHPTDAEILKCPAIIDLYDAVQRRTQLLPQDISESRLLDDATDCIGILNENFGTFWTIDSSGIQKD